MQDSRNFADAMLNQEDQGVLRRSHKRKTTAKDYVAEIGQENLEEVLELREVHQEVIESMDLYVDTRYLHHLKEAGRLLGSFAAVLHQLMEFGDLAVAVRTLSEFLNALEESQVEGREKKILVYMHNIMEDLANWRQQIFEEQGAQDIHYLDSSLFSSCLQFQLEFSTKEDEEGEDLGLELF